MSMLVQTKIVINASLCNGASVIKADFLDRRLTVDLHSQYISEDISSPITQSLLFGMTFSLPQKNRDLLEINRIDVHENWKQLEEKIDNLQACNKVGLLGVVALWGDFARLFRQIGVICAM